MRIRLYKAVINTWYDIDYKQRKTWIQKEISYIEIDSETGETAAEGTEDFSPERYLKEVKETFVYLWDGLKRNKGGNRWFNYYGFVKVRKSDVKAFKEFMQMKYNAKAVNLR